MTLLDLLQKAAGIPVDQLRALLQRLVELEPEAAGQVAKLMEALDKSLGPEALLATSQAILLEVGKVLQGKFAGTDRPSDAI